MRYALKDKNLQKMMDDITRGEFSKRLDEGAKLNGITGVFEVRFNICGVYVEERQEYNPHGWNNFPEVTPPENVWMRCEFGAYKCVARWVPLGDTKEYGWIDISGREVNVERYRPWEE